MIIYPAIDLLHGRCVRMCQGDVNAETVFSEDPAQMARHWASQGAEWLHVKNLDGALGATKGQLAALHKSPDNDFISDDTISVEKRSGHRLPVNLLSLLEIRRSVDASIQFAGGLHTMDDIQLALELGADRVVLGSVAVEKPRLVSEAIERWGAERILVGIEAHNGIVASDGWQKTSHIHIVELGHQVHAMGVRTVVYTDITDIHRNGTSVGISAGINIDATARLGDITGLHVIASGEISGVSDIERLKAHEHYNIDGVIVDAALCKGNVDLRSAIELGHEPLRRRSAGIVPYRRGKNGPEFLLLFNLFFEQWQFPRGGVEVSESDIACAWREFQEETGLSIQKLHEDCRVELHYMANIRNYVIERTVVYYLAEVVSGEVSLGDENHCEERWVDAHEAWELLTETGPEQLPALDAAIGYLQGLPQR
jgi:phosphoribosylformimino-5-aminoimidazole carboxamide ribotide isomerase